MSDLTVAAAASSVDVGDEAGSGRLRRIGRALEFWVPAGFLIVLALACFVWPEIYSLPDPIKGNLADISLPVGSPGHILGTDPLGNDILSRLLYGGRVSLIVGVGSALIGMVVGGALGITAAYKGGWVDTVITRGLDMFLAFPSLVLAMTVATYLGPSVLNVTLAISFFSVPAFARLARATTQRLVGQNFVTAAKLGGAGDTRVMLRHITPNVVPGLLTYSLLYVSIAIIIEASLSFLGLGIRPPNPTWGNMIQVGQQNIYTDPALLLIPSALLFVTVLALNLLGDAVRARWSE